MYDPWVRRGLLVRSSVTGPFPQQRSPESRLRNRGRTRTVQGPEGSCGGESEEGGSVPLENSPSRQEVEPLLEEEKLGRQDFGLPLDREALRPPTALERGEQEPLLEQSAYEGEVEGVDGERHALRKERRRCFPRPQSSHDGRPQTRRTFPPSFSVPVYGWVRLGPERSGFDSVECPRVSSGMSACTLGQGGFVWSCRGTEGRTREWWRVGTEDFRWEWVVTRVWALRRLYGCVVCVSPETGGSVCRSEVRKGLRTGEKI